MSIFASPYTDAFCLQAVHLILDALPRAYARRRRPRGADGDGQRRDASPGSPSPTPSSASTTRSPTPSARASASPTAAPTRSSCPTCCATTRRSPRSSCRRRATRPTSRRRSTRRSPGSSASAATARTSARERLFARVDELLDAVGMPRSLADAGHRPEAEFDAALPDLAAAAFARPEPAHQPAHAAARRAAGSCWPRRRDRSASRAGAEELADRGVRLPWALDLGYVPAVQLQVMGAAAARRATCRRSRSGRGGRGGPRRTALRGWSPCRRVQKPSSPWGSSR